ncbi:hypothetical protein ACP275_04G099000 [Erythranthe tilingii]
MAMFWKRIYLPKLVKKRDNSTKRSQIRRVNDRKNLVLEPIGVDSGEEGLLWKRKIVHLSNESDKSVLKKKRRTGEITVVSDKNLNVDRISELPEPIIHLILSFLRCTKDVVRTSILSKKWKSMFDSYLTFDFDERWFKAPLGKGKHNRIKARELQKRDFRNYVDKSLSTRLDPFPCIDKFRLYVNCTVDTKTANIDRWISSAVDKHVKELDFQVNPKGKQYILPENVLRSRSITSMKLLGCLLICVDPIKLSNLRQLSLKDVRLVNEELIKKFEEGCPLIEDLRLVFCRGLSRLTITSLPKLRRVEVHECPKITCIRIAAQNLESFWYHAKTHQHCSIDLKGSENLKNLTLKDWNLTDAAFQDCLLKCPLLEKLVLHECTSLEKLTILSGKLRSLTLTQCLKLVEVNIDAPKLYSFQYSGHTMPFSSMNVSGLCEAKFSFDPIMKMSECIVDCQKLFGNFDRLQGFKLIVYCKQNMKIYETPREAYFVRNHFCKLEMTSSLAGVCKIVDNWLRECHGSTISLLSPSSELTKLIHTMVMDREENPKCCGFYANKCWKHYLEDVITSNTTYGFKWRSRQRNH